MDGAADRVARELLPDVDRFVAFVRRRVGDEALAADVVQESLLRALRASGALGAETRLVPWFYRVLGNAVTDVYRRRGTESAALDRYAAEPRDDARPEDDPEACACLLGLLDGLKPEYAELVRAMDLGGEPSEAVAERLGVTRNNLKVRHHRARQQLRERLELACRTCAEHGCLDCTCS